MGTVLVVDDHPVNRDVLVTLLTHGGHQALEAADGAEALAVARERLPDLVITDLVMPVMDGYELVSEIRADPQLAGIKVIFYTAVYLLDEVRPAAANAGVAHVLSKPADARLMLRVVRETLASGAPAPLPGSTSDEFQREHLRAVSSKLADKVQELETTESALRESEARFRTLTECAPVGIFSLSADGQLTYGNPRFLEAFGGRSTPARQWTVWLHDDDRRHVVSELSAARRANTPYRDRVRVTRPGDVTRWVDIQAVPVSGDGTQSSYVGTAEDVTEVVTAQWHRDEMETRLRTSERLEGLGKLAAGIAHDFNNLLGVIVNYAHFVETGLAELAATSTPAPPQRLHDDAEAIGEAAGRAADLVSQLLLFAKSEIVHPETLDLNEVVVSGVRLLSRTIGEHVVLRTELGDDLPPILADRGRIEQVLVNLVVNARDAVGEAGTVTVATDSVVVDTVTAQLHAARPGHYARLTVSDDGEGMTADTAAHAFDPFFTTKPTGQGTGLGLASAYGIVTQLGGHLVIYSEPGHGTTMRVYLPATIGTVTSTAPAEQTGLRGDGQRVLVVEDDPRLLEVTVRILAGNGYDVVPAGDGDSALSVLRDSSQRVDLLLTDVVMPRLSGLEVAAHASQLRPDLAVLYMSGYAEGLTTPGAPPAPDVTLLEKPFSQVSLLAAVGRALHPRGASP